ncbi:uncharacterized protein TRIADDRAFT_58727 [Trichoplax adhaerens]|uniref:Uncharacterized protein n=1 Tax=Trichoplax adhaerens TaxID=10228 RepID=B3S3H9_TRIAD|nr:predicted protein [Trichoplax adhaerens]EDV22796.1 predicted protein [Trichoplax adhaerens]|eukprot:XP_002114662.1 predicted protein [Trichoplax adhaerens]
MARRSDPLAHSWSGNSMVLPPIPNQHHSEAPTPLRHHRNHGVATSSHDANHNVKLVPNHIGRLLSEQHGRSRTLSSPMMFDRQRANSFTAAASNSILAISESEKAMKQSNSIDTIDHKKMLKKLHHRSVTMISINGSLGHDNAGAVSLTDKALLSPKLLRSARYSTPAAVSNNIESESSRGGSENPSRPVSIDDYKTLLGTMDQESNKLQSLNDPDTRNHQSHHADQGTNDENDNSALIDDDHSKKQQGNSVDKNRRIRPSQNNPTEVGQHQADQDYRAVNRAKCESWLDGLKDIDYSMPTADVITDYND